MKELSEGCEFKAMVDIAADDKTVDFKTVASFDEMWLDGQKVSLSVIGAMISGSNLSGATPPADGVRKPFYLACVTKEPVPDIAVIQIATKSWLKD